MRNGEGFEALDEALILWQGPASGLRDDPEGALRELLKDARRRGLPVMEIAFRACDEVRRGE